MLGTGWSRSGERADTDNGAENGDPAASEGAGDSEEDQEGLASPPASGADWADLEERRRQLRHKYRTLINEMQENRLDLIKPGSKGLNDRLIKGNELFQNGDVKPGTREAVLDYQFLVLASTLGSQKAHQLHTDLVTFELHVFADKLVEFMTDRQANPEDPDEEERRSVVRVPAAGWEKLGEEARRHFNRAPAFHFLYGSFNREAKARESRKLNRKDANESIGPKIVPKLVTSSDEDAKSESDTLADRDFMYKALRILTIDESDDVDPIDYFEFVMDPDSFARTVENIFHLSYLIRDGNARIYLNDDQLPVIEPAEPYTEAEAHERVDKQQVFISLTINDWKRIKKEFQISSRAFPRRVDVEGLDGPSGGQSGHTSSDEEDIPTVVVTLTPIQAMRTFGMEVTWRQSVGGWGTGTGAAVETAWNCPLYGSPPKRGK
ncbi:PREDICTED: EP300-interacting inhibitor of differentiation 3-like [Branchiostoma belcheri]|uniref:Non-structural maintenance of chromosomes element 4 n=1 Tax=Branchiostoma belcheri TaxID=7741 RepID=A0A6P4YER5_BRABE|nr:PREDICTED: EP300-interacting inhibitor of differentiation 3-like [Branchiostoma belcheri]